MNKPIFRIFICLLAFAGCLYSYIDKQNQLTRLKMTIPTLMKDIKGIQEENARLQYEIDQFESPEHLMELARRSEFSHLKHPLMKDIVTLPQGVALQLTTDKDSALAPQLKLPIATMQK